jgi:hypothetical protein
MASNAFPAAQELPVGGANKYGAGLKCRRAAGGVDCADGEEVGGTRGDMSDVAEGESVGCGAVSDNGAYGSSACGFGVAGSALYARAGRRRIRFEEGAIGDDVGGGAGVGEPGRELLQ